MRSSIMSCSMAANSRPAIGERGFTLIEMMVVVLIIGLMAAGIVLSVGITGRDTELEKESDRVYRTHQIRAREGRAADARIRPLTRRPRVRVRHLRPAQAIWRPVEEDDALRAAQAAGGPHGCDSSSKAARSC